MPGEETVRERSVDQIEDWLVGQIAGLLSVPAEDVDVREPLVSFGLSSQEMVILAGDLEEWLGRQLSPTLAWEYPTIEALARHLAGANGGESASVPA